jgi:hypothetical protein
MFPLDADLVKPRSRRLDRALSLIAGIARRRHCRGGAVLIPWLADWGTILCFGL